MTTRRKFLGGCAALAMMPAMPVHAAQALRIGMTPALLHTQHGLLGQWRSYMESQLRRQVVFVQRDSYRETMDLLRLGQIDFAWICSYPYVYLRNYVRLVAVPLYHWRPYYRAYLIVPERKPRISNLSDLRGKVFAYADPYSNSGYLVPRYQLRVAGEDPAKFFARTFFTYSHRKVIEAVADGLVDGGSVDGYIWDSLDMVKHDITSRTWPVSQSEEYGFPPFVAHHAISQEDFMAMQRMLITMRYDAQGKALLKALNLDGFTLSDDKLYDNVARMMAAFDRD
jgi:phosphonate transport system substrate-binding protein